MLENFVITNISEPLKSTKPLSTTSKLIIVRKSAV